MNGPMGIFWLVFFAIVYGIIIARFLYSRFGRTVKVSATVVHKQKVEQKSFKTPPYISYKYAVTFQIGNKRKSFQNPSLTKMARIQAAPRNTKAQQ
jgi:predicted permease